MYQYGKNITFTERTNDSVNMFLRDIRRSAPLTTDEEYALWCQMRQGSQSAKSKLIYANLRYVVTIAKKYVVSGASFDDLLMAGSLGITMAADKFDASLGNRFISFATWYIESEIQKTAYDHLRHKCATVSLDEPICSDEEDSDTLLSRLPSSAAISPDWQVSYDDTLSALKRSMDKRYWKGTGEMLDDYLSMTEKGLATADFVRKYHLSDQQLRSFLDMVHTVSRHQLKTAA